MSTIVTMSSTVGRYTSGQTYRLRSKEADVFLNTSKATKTNTKKTTNSNEGK